MRFRLDVFQKQFVDMIAADWSATGEWPLKVELRVRLARMRPRRHIDQVLGRLDLRLWQPQTMAGDPEGQRIMLTPAGLELAKNGREFVRPLLEVVQLAAKRRIEEPFALAKVSTADLALSLGRERQTELTRTQHYLDTFWPGSGSSHNPNGTIEHYAGFDIICFEKISSGAELLALRNSQPRVLKSSELQRPHLELLRAIYRHWHEEGEPPALVPFVLAHRHRGDVLSLLRELPYDVIDNSVLSTNDEQLPTSRLKLRFLGYVLAAKNEEPTLFARTLPILRAHFEKHPGRAAPITAQELADQLRVSLVDILRLRDLFEGEGHAGLQVVTMGESWGLAITSRILDWRVRGIDAYLKRRAKEVAKTADDIAGEAYAQLNPAAVRNRPRRSTVSPRRTGPALTFEEILRSRNLIALEKEHLRALRNVGSDPPAALTSASSLLETLFKLYIDEEGLDLPADRSLKPLWKTVREHLHLDPDVSADQDMKSIFGSLSGVVDGIGSLRTHAGSAHGHGHPTLTIEERHAMLALNAAYTLAIFVVQDWNARNT